MQREEITLGSFRDGSDGGAGVPLHLSGSFWRDFNNGTFTCDESDAEYTEMYERVSRWDLQDPSTGLRIDAGETGTITRQLLYVKAKTYDVKYPMFRARDFIPVSHDVDTGAESWAYWQYDSFGMAKMIANYAHDFPRVDVKVQEFRQPIVPLGVSYAYTVQDLRRIAFMSSNGTSRGANIDAKRAGRARMAMESAIDDIAAVGAPDGGFVGFVNNPNVPILAAPNGNWSASTSLQMIADMNAAWRQIMVTTKQVEIPDTALFPTSLFGIFAGQPFSTLGDKSVASWFVSNNPHINQIDQWYKLDKANAAGTGGRIVVYRHDADAVFMEIPQEFEQFAPQLEGMEYSVPCHARMGGVAWPYPLSGLYLDGCEQP